MHHCSEKVRSEQRLRMILNIMLCLLLLTTASRTEEKPHEWISSYSKQLLSNLNTLMVNCQSMCSWNSVYNKDLFWVPNTQCIQSKLVMFVKITVFVHHFYADDSQHYLSFKSTDNVAYSEALMRMESCLNEIVVWMHDNMLKRTKLYNCLFLYAQRKVWHLTRWISNIH